MVRVCDHFQRETPEGKLKVDAILISQNPKISLTQLLKFYDCSLIIADGTNKTYRIKTWAEEAKLLHVNFYAVMKEGAWMRDL
jgi:hypothetical protein